MSEGSIQHPSVPGSPTTIDLDLARVALRVVGAVLVVLVSALPAGAVLPQQLGRVDLLTQANVRLDGAGAGDLAGLSVAGAGDVNADGRADVIVGVWRADNNG